MKCDFGLYSRTIKVIKRLDIQTFRQGDRIEHDKICSPKLDCSTLVITSLIYLTCPQYCYGIRGNKLKFWALIERT